MTTNPTAPSGAVRPTAPAGRHRITDYDSLIDELAYTYDGTFAGSHPADQINPVAVQVLAERHINLTRTPNRSPAMLCMPPMSPSRWGAVTPVRSIPVSATWTGTSPTRTTTPSRRYAISATISEPASPPCFETSTSN